MRAGRYWHMERKRWFDVEKSAFPTVHGISAEAVDWDGDGDLDLLLGTTDGRALLHANGGTPTAPRFSAQADEVRCDGTEGAAPLRVAGGYSMPTAADWDGDGRFDLLSGSGTGGVTWWRNVGEPGAPRFAAGEALVPEADLSEDVLAPGLHSQVTVADFDGDGDADLLVGDHRRTPEGGRHGFVWLYRRR